MNAFPARSGMTDFLLTVVPDHCCWIEARSMLLYGDGEITGFRRDPPSAVIRHLYFPLVCVVGRPHVSDVLRGAAIAGPYVEILVPPGCVSGLESTAEWRTQEAIIHGLLDNPGPLSKNASVIRYMKASDPLDHVPPAFKSELRSAQAVSRVAAAFVGRLPVSFCYAGARSETLWDVSVETLPEYRNRGLAGGVASFLIAELRSRGLDPVWGALESNLASVNLARKLGFRPIDRLKLLTRQLEE